MRCALNLKFWYHGAHDDAYSAVVYLINHVVEQLGTLQFEDEQRVFLLVAGIVYAVLEFVEQSQVLLPCVVNNVKDDCFVESSHDRARLTLVSFLEVRRDVVLTVASNDGHHEVFIHCSLRPFVDGCHDFMSIVHHNLCLLLEAFQYLLVSEFSHIVEFHCFQLLGCEGNFHCHDFEETQAATLVIVVLKDVADAVPNHVAYVHAETFADEGVTTLLVDNRTLLVHYVIILQQVLTNTEVVFLDTLLCILNAASNHAVLNHLAILEAKAVHHSGNTFAGEETHQLVLDTNKEDAAARVTLTTGTSA